MRTRIIATLRLDLDLTDFDKAQDWVKEGIA